MSEIVSESSVTRGTLGADLISAVFVAIGEGISDDPSCGRLLGANAGAGLLNIGDGIKDGASVELIPSGGGEVVGPTTGIPTLWRRREVVRSHDPSPCYLPSRCFEIICLN